MVKKAAKHGSLASDKESGKDTKVPVARELEPQRGKYRTITAQAIRKSRSITSGKIAELQPGTMVDVAEVDFIGAGRVRGRVTDPRGWITLVDAHGEPLAELADEDSQLEADEESQLERRDQEADIVLAEESLGHSGSQTEQAAIRYELERAFAGPGLDAGIDDLCKRAELHDICADLVASVTSKAALLKDLRGMVERGIVCDWDAQMIADARGHLMRLGVHHSFTLDAKKLVQDFRRQLPAHLRMQFEFTLFTPDGRADAVSNVKATMQKVRDLPVRLRQSEFKCADDVDGLQSACAEARELQVHHDLARPAEGRLWKLRRMETELKAEAQGCSDVFAWLVHDLQRQLQIATEDDDKALALSTACTRASLLGVHASLVQRARAALTKYFSAVQDQLERELTGAIVPATLEVACARAERLGACQSLVLKARDILRQVSGLEAQLQREVKDAHDVKVLRAACDEAAKFGVYRNEVAGVQHAINKYLQDLERQLWTKVEDKHDLAVVRAACGEAVKLGVHIHQAANRQRHLDHILLELAMQLHIKVKDARDVEALGAACDRATELGVHLPQVANARRALDQYARDQRLLQALEEQLKIDHLLGFEQVEALKGACFEADRRGVFSSLVSKARRLLDQYGELQRLLAMKVNSARDAQILETACAQAEDLRMLPDLTALAKQELAKFQARREAVVIPEHRARLTRLLAHVSDGSGEDLLKHIVGDQCRIYSLVPGEYDKRGGRRYFKPHGWLKFAVQVQQVQDLHQDWCVAYHGTSGKNVASILAHGLVRPGDAAGDRGVRAAHGQSGSKTRKSIYLSPSIEYAAFPVYSEFVEVGCMHWAQLVLQCRVRPGSFKEQRGTLGMKYWPSDVYFDQHFPGIEGLEWLVENPNDIVVSALLVREFGPNADASIFGEVATRVRDVDLGPQYEWTRLRAAEQRRLGFAVPPPPPPPPAPPAPPPPSKQWCVLQ